MTIGDVGAAVLKQGKAIAHLVRMTRANTVSIQNNTASIRSNTASIQDNTASIAFIVENMVTKGELQEVKEELKQEINSKNDGVHQRIDQELDKRKLLEVRVSRMETRGR